MFEQIIGVFVLLFIALAIGVYVYFALALSTIAKKTRTENPWLAWIPIANLYLMCKIARMPWWTFLLMMVSWIIPFIGNIGSMVILILWWWKICERRNYSGYLALLWLIPIAGLVLMGVLAWADSFKKTKKKS